LRQLREARGWDCAQLAKLSSLSASQVQALESGSMDCFYTLKIKNNAARKVAQVLGASPADVIIVREVPVSEADDTAQIKPASHSLSLERRYLQSKTQPSSWMGYAVMSLLLLAGLGWYGLRHNLSIATSNNVMAKTPASLPAMPEPVAPAQLEKELTPNASSSPVDSNATLASAQTVTPLVSANPIRGESEISPAALNSSTESKPTSCAFDGDAAVLEAANPTKSPEKISLMLHKPGLLCVQDSSGKVWQEELKPWLGRTFIGKAPWKLYSPVLPYADVFFQGEKIQLPSTVSRSIALNGKAVNR
jgi:transcriptional regulator with XRE-family HTH domain